MAAVLGLPLALFGASYLARSASPAEIPSEVAWTEATLTQANGGDPFRGLLLARRCDHCHGAEGFSDDAAVPNLANLDRLTIWKQLEDYRTDKRASLVMRGIAVPLSTQNRADLAAYYSMLPNSPDPQDERVFPQAAANGMEASLASRLVTLGDSAEFRHAKPVMGRWDRFVGRRHWRHKMAHTFSASWKGLPAGCVRMTSICRCGALLINSRKRRGAPSPIITGQDWGCFPAARDEHLPGPPSMHTPSLIPTLRKPRRVGQPAMNICALALIPAAKGGAHDG